MNIFKKITSKGWRWLFHRTVRELKNPTIKPVATLINAILSVKQRIKRLGSKPRDSSMLYAIYDLEINSITFNFIEFLVDAECEIRRRNKEGFVVIIVPADSQQNSLLAWEEYDSVIDRSNKQWRFHNIVLPLANLASKCHGIYVLPSRAEVKEFVIGRDVYPDLYDGTNLRSIDFIKLWHKLDRPGMFDGLRAPQQGLIYIKEWMRINRASSPIVTITIRDFPFDKARNSNLLAWAQFAKEIQKLGFFPVVVPDTSSAFDLPECLNDVTFFRECSWNLGLRLALYESAFLNLFVPNGCAALAIFDPRCSYIIMNSLPKNSNTTTEESYKKIGYSIGDNYRFSTRSQRLCYEPDSFENILNEFNRFWNDHKRDAQSDPTNQ